MGEEGEGGGVEGAADLLLSDTCTIPYRNCVTKIPLTLSLAVDFLYMYTYCTVLYSSAVLTRNKQEKPRSLVLSRQAKPQSLTLYTVQ